MEYKFNYYDADIRKSTSLGTVSLDYLLKAIKEPKKDIKHIFEQIKLAEENGNLEEKAKLKTKLYSFTPCVLSHGARKYDNIISWTGLMVLDFDHLETDYCIEFKQDLFNEYSFIIATWLSPSKHGIKVLLSIPVCNSVEEFKHRFNAVEKIFGKYKGFDSTSKNCILVMFLSYDENLLYRENYTTFTKKIIPVTQPPKPIYFKNENAKAVETVISRKLNEISDAGHQILRATSYLLGGYVGGGMIDKYDAIVFINNLIDSHSYLRQKANVYKTTAKTMIEKGISEPTKIE